MKTKIAENKVEMHGNFEVNTFQVEASAQMFKIISDTMYSRPIEAIVRELACNAYDSHKENGNEDEPFIIKLPTPLNQNFYIKDFGTGLSPQEVKELYTVVFKSDKTHTNDMTGCFGLGSKTPFAYTKQFSVESTWNGVRHNYSIFMNDEMIPSFTKMGEVEVDEPNGFKVSFHVKKEDFYKFEKVAEKVAKYFDTIPEVKGLGRELNPLEYGLEGDGWGFKDNDSQTLAIMGNVAYNINSQKIDNYISNVDLYFDLGDLTPAASREELQYDDDTIAAIKGAFAKVKSECLNKVEKEVNQEDNYFQACVNFYNLKLQGNIGALVYGKDISHDKTGLPINNSISIYDNDLAKKDGTQIFTVENGKKSNSKISKWYDFTFCKKIKSCGSWGSVTGYEVQKPQVVYADQSYGKYSRTEYLSTQNPDDMFFLVSGDEKTAEKLADKLLLDSYHLVSEMDPKPKEVKASASNMAEADFLNLKKGWSNLDTWWELCDDKPEQCYFVTISRYKWRFDNGGEYTQPSHLWKIQSYLSSVGVDINIIGVKNRFFDDAKDIDGWKPLKDELTNFINFVSGSKGDKSQTIAINFRDKCKYGCKFLDLFRRNKDAIDDIKDKDLKEICEIYIEGGKRCDTNAGLLSGIVDKMNLATTDSIEIKSKKTKVDKEVEKLVEKKNKIKARYPLFDEASYWHDVQGWLEYANCLYEQKYKDN